MAVFSAALAAALIAIVIQRALLRADERAAIAKAELLAQEQRRADIWDSYAADVADALLGKAYGEVRAEEHGTWGDYARATWKDVDASIAEAINLLQSAPSGAHPSRLRAAIENAKAAKENSHWGR